MFSWVIAGFLLISTSMTINSVEVNAAKPNQLKIVSLGIGISDETNDSLNLTDTQHLLVAERQRFATCNEAIYTYGLVVDKEGVAINATRDERAANRSQYSLYVDGSVFVTGAIIACNVISGGSNLISGINGNGNGNGTGLISGCNFWVLAAPEQDSIYYPGKVTFGKYNDARRHEHTVNIVQSANRSVDRAQVSIQNTAGSQMRLGILGTSNISPMVMNTRRGIPMEFHAGRDQSYFSQRYLKTEYRDGQLVTLESELPRYESRTVSPHMMIDPNGNVGIRTSRIDPISYQVRTINPTRPQEILFPTMNEPMSLHVDGPMFASNILIYDYETGRPENIDRLYVRRLGVSIEANQIIPGPFALGEYRFLSNIAIAGPTEQDFGLKVHGSARVTDRLQVDNIARVNLLEATDAVLLDIASFCNDVYVNRDVIIKESLRLRGGMFTEVIDGDDVYWCNVQFTVAQEGFQNINYIGAGFSTPGRLGVGIDPQTDEVNNQLVVRKRLSDIYELELYDKSSSKLHKVAFIGHPPTDSERVADGSLVFSTPSSRDPDYNRDGVYPDAPQNFYFYPGGYNLFAEAIVRANNPPTLNVHTRKKVGILTFDPEYELDVTGSVRFTGSMYNGNTKLGLWSEKEYPNIYVSGGSNPTFIGIEYYKENASNVGVNSPADPRYGMTVSGKLRSVDGFYDENDVRMGIWYNSVDAANIVAPSSYTGKFTYDHVGIGINRPTDCLEMKNNYGQPTVLRLYRPDGGEVIPESVIEFAGLEDPWILKAHDTYKRFEFGFGSNTFLSDVNPRAWWARVHPTSHKQQVVVGGDMNIFDRANHPKPNASLTVDGDMAVFGDVAITGRYMINATELVNSNVLGEVPIQLQTDDVLIAGDRLLMNPRRTMAVGFTAARLINQNESADPSVFKVFQADASVPNIARFICAGNNGFIEIASTATGAGSLRLGFQNNNGFVISNRQNVPFLNFNSNVATGENFMAINNVQGAATANLHVQTTGVGSNMFRLTRFLAGSDSTSLAPQFELEKRISASTGNTGHRWILHGPDASFEQKLSMRYGESATPGVASEVFTFTRTGCIGIGNTEPEFGLDVKGADKRGSLRLYNTSATPIPQLIFQSGSSVYGADSLTDYRIYTGSNNFFLDSVNNVEYKKLLHFNEYGNLGISTSPTSNYTVNIGGTLNVKSTIFLDGSPLFDAEGSDSQEGFNIRAINIFLRPRTEYAGGVMVNRTIASSNLFHINRGFNNNMMVYDSPFPEAQVHFRTITALGSQKFNMYRMAMSNERFMWEHLPNSSNADYIRDTHTGWSNVLGWGPSSRNSNEYDMNLHGSMHMISEAPWMRMQDSIFAYNRGHFNLLPMLSNIACNVSIGTTQADATLQVVGSNSYGTFAVRQHGTGDIMRMGTSNVTYMRMMNNGNVGMGTTVPLRTVHIHGDMYVTSGIATVPSMVFTSSPNTGVFSPSADHFMVQTASAERLRITETGNVGIGTTVPLARVDVRATTTVPLLRGTQLGSGNLLELNNTSGQRAVTVTSNMVGINRSAPTQALDVLGNMVIEGSIVPKTDSTFNLGSATQRWKDIYLSGSTLDINGTTISQTNTGDLRIGNSETAILRRVVMKELQLGDQYSSNNLVLQRGVTDPIVFVDVNVNTGDRVEYVPFVKSSTQSGISLGVDIPEALMHLVGHTAAPTLIVDYDGVGDNVMQVRANNEPSFTVSATGNVGIGTTVPVTKLHVYSSNLSSTVTIDQERTQGNFVQFGRGVGTKAVFTGTGNLGIGNTAPQAKLHVTGPQRFEGEANFLERVYCARDVEIQGNNVVHGDQTTDSDRNLKTNLQKIENALEKVKTLTGYTFMKTTTNQPSTGLVAQEVQEVLPEAVTSDPETGTLRLAYGNLMGLIVESIKDLSSQIESLKK